MYLSRLAFHSIPGKTHDVQERLKKLKEMVAASGAARCRILRTHFASMGAPDVVFEQEAADLRALEDQIAAVTRTAEFQAWSEEMSALLRESPKREIYLLED